MAATDARFVPIKNQAFRVYIPLLNSSGDAQGVASFDSTLGGGTGKAIVIKDDGAPANSTNSILTGAGGYNFYLDLTATEMNADAVTVVFRSPTSGVIDGMRVLYTEPRGIRDLAYPSVTGRSTAVAADGSLTVGSILANVLTAAAIQDGAFTNPKFADNFLTAAKIATDAITSDELSASALLEITAACQSAAAFIADAVWDEPLVEPSSVPAVTAQMRQAMAWWLVQSRNKRTQTATTEALRNAADAANIATSTKSDDGTTYTRGAYS